MTKINKLIMKSMVFFFIFRFYKYFFYLVTSNLFVKNNKKMGHDFEMMNKLYSYKPLL